MWEISGRTKRKLLYVNVGLYGILNAVEYSVVLPTLWLYLSSIYGSQSWYFGLCISGFHMSALTFAPVFGIANDRGFKTKSLVMFANLFQILGSILYMIRSEWLVFTARLVAGVGSAVGSLMYADVNRVTTVDDRTSVLAVIMLCRQLGLFFGPAANLFLAQFDFHVGPIHVDRFTAPGFLMTVVWIVYQVVMGVSYYNVDQLRDTDEREINENSETSSREPLLPPVQRGTVNTYGSTSTSADSAHVTSPERSSVPTTASSSSSSSSPTSTLSSVPTPSSTTDSTPSTSVQASAKRQWGYMMEFTSEPIVVALTVFFVSNFAQMTLETMVTPVTERLFGFGEMENSLVYAVAGGLIFVVCIVIMLVGRKCDDRALTLIGLVFMVIAVLWAAIALPSERFEPETLLWHFVGSTFFDLVGLTVVCITSMSLYSKLLDDSMQGFGMGMRRAAVCLGLIMGPLWAGALINRLYIMLFVLFALLLINAIMFSISYSRLAVRRPLPSINSETNPAV